jgi:hypothetical protein
MNLSWMITVLEIRVMDPTGIQKPLASTLGV